MSHLQALLNYQEIDKKLIKIENEFAESEERKKYVKLQKFLKVAPERLDALETKAAALKSEADGIVKKYEQVEALLADFENLDELIGGGADVSFYKKKAQSVVEQLKKLKADMNTLVSAIKETDAEFQKMKKQVIVAQKQYSEASETYKQAKASRDNDSKGLIEELEKAAKDIAPDLFARYQTKRKEKIFPIVGEVNGGRCPFCSMEPPLAAQKGLANGIECDNCHRIIFSK